MRVQTEFSSNLGLRLPLIQAPMAGGPSSQELVAACSAAGALGSFGFAYTQPDEMRRQAAFVRSKTERPFGINLFVSALPGAIEPTGQRAALDAVAAYYKELGLPAPQPIAPPYAPDLEAQLAAVEDIKPRVFTTHLGVLPKDRIKALQARNILVGGSATCVAEAKQLEELGCDFVIAQGGEAGGHRGTHLRNPAEAMTGTFALVRLVVRATRLPVIAAGGIMDGAGVAACLALGAQAAQLGTAFIPCPESGAAEVHKQELLRRKEDETAITDRFSGKPARGLVNRFFTEMAGAPYLAFPAQNRVTGPLRQASGKAGRPDFVALWAGQAAPLSRALPAAQLIQALEAETLAALEAVSSLQKA